MAKPILAFTVKKFIEESNSIEGIVRSAYPYEVEAVNKFLALPSVSIDDLCELAYIFTPQAILRRTPGMNVMVGNHLPPLGGSDLVDSLDELLDYMNRKGFTPYELYCAYEWLHPFMDGNGRTGRALWLRYMGGIRCAPLGFLKHWHYQTLAQYKPQD